MTFKNYFRLIKPTVYYFFKISGLIFTVFATIIWGVCESVKVDDSLNPLEIFALCLLFGNVLGLFTIIVGVADGFSNVKLMERLFESLPTRLKEEYQVGLFLKPLNYKNNFLQIEIRSNKPGAPVFFINKSRFPDGFCVEVLAFYDQECYTELRKKIIKNYPRKRISLTHLGLSKIVERKMWKKLSSYKMDTFVDELILICQKEGMEVLAISE